MLFPVEARIALNKTFAKITCSEASANSEESPQVAVHLSVSASLLYEQPWPRWRAAGAADPSMCQCPRGACYHDRPIKLSWPSAWRSFL